MGQEFKLIIFLVWFPQATRQVLSWIYWWQVKEYRYDRFKALLASSDGRKNLEVNFIVLKLLLLLALPVFQEVFWIILFVFFVLDIRLLIQVVDKRLRRPVFTQRARRIFNTSLIFVFLTVLWILWSQDMNLSYPLLFGEAALLFTPLFGILWTKPIVNKIKKEEVERARKKLKRVKPIVIGVTGSYGKTTTKDFIAHLLSQKYKTAKTTGSENTEFGIARKTINFIKKGTRFYVVEMGAYKRGEIHALAKIVSPKVGVITGIEPQHLSLFGGLEEIKKTKFELIDVLPPDGTAVFNLSNKYCRELARKTMRLYPELKVVGHFLSRKGRPGVKADIESKILSADINGVTFEVMEGKITKRLFAPIGGVHFIENLSCAILVARIFDVDWKQISKGCESIKMPDKTMAAYKSKKGAYIIDDTYNTTPRGFESAVRYITLFKDKKKAVITPGIIELGKLSKKIHRNLGKLMRDEVDEIIFTNRDFTESIKQGLGGRRAKLKVIERPERLHERFMELVDNNYVVLLEGRMPKSLMDVVERYKNK